MRCCEACGPVMLISCQRWFHSQPPPPTSTPFTTTAVTFPQSVKADFQAESCSSASAHIKDARGGSGGGGGGGGGSIRKCRREKERRKSAGSGLGRFFTHGEAVRRVDLLIQKLCDLPEGSTSLEIISALLIAHHFAKHRSTNHTVIIHQKQFFSILNSIIARILIIPQ